jgi:hypothetical protein
MPGLSAAGYLLLLHKQREGPCARLCSQSLPDLEAGRDGVRQPGLKVRKSDRRHQRLSCAGARFISTRCALVTCYAWYSSAWPLSYLFGMLADDDHHYFVLRARSADGTWGAIARFWC